MLRSIPSYLLAILSFFLILFLYVKLAGPIPFAVSSVNTNKSDTFNVSGEGKVFVKPDTAYVTVGIQAEGNTVNQAQDQINQVINKVSQGIKDLGVSSDDIQTTNYDISPKYDFTSGRQRVNGYQANTNLRIKVKDTEKINQVIDAATANGANQVNGVSFEVADKAKAENEAREKAVVEAKKKAEAAASIAGFKLGRIINYSEDFGGPISPSIRSVTLDTKEATQVEPGTSEIKVNVTLSYELR